MNVGPSAAAAVTHEEASSFLREPSATIATSPPDRVRRGAAPDDHSCFCRRTRTRCPPRSSRASRATARRRPSPRRARARAAAPRGQRPREAQRERDREEQQRSAHQVDVCNVLCVSSRSWRQVHRISCVWSMSSSGHATRRWWSPPRRALYVVVAQRVVPLAWPLAIALRSRPTARSCSGSCRARRARRRVQCVALGLVLSALGDACLEAAAPRRVVRSASRALPTRTCRSSRVPAPRRERSRARLAASRARLAVRPRSRARVPKERREREREGRHDDDPRALVALARVPHALLLPATTIRALADRRPSRARSSSPRRAGSPCWRATWPACSSRTSRPANSRSRSRSRCTLRARLGRGAALRDAARVGAAAQQRPSSAAACRSATRRRVVNSRRPPAGGADDRDRPFTCAPRSRASRSRRVARDPSRTPPRRARRVERGDRCGGAWRNKPPRGRGPSMRPPRSSSRPRARPPFRRRAGHASGGHRRRGSSCATRARSRRRLELAAEDELRARQTRAARAPRPPRRPRRAAPRAAAAAFRRRRLRGVRGRVRRACASRASSASDVRSILRRWRNDVATTWRRSRESTGRRAAQVEVA